MIGESISLFEPKFARFSNKQPFLATQMAEEVVFSPATNSPSPLSEEKSGWTEIAQTPDLTVANDNQQTNITPPGVCAGEGEGEGEGKGELVGDEEDDVVDDRSSGSIIDLKRIKRGWNVFSLMAARTYEESIKPAIAVASEKSSKFIEEQAKPAVAKASQAAAKAAEDAQPYLDSAKVKAAEAWEVTKEKSAVAYEQVKVKSTEAYEKVKPHLDECATTCDLGVKSLVAYVSGKPNAAVTAASSSGSDDESSAPSVLDSSTKGSFTI